MTAKCGPIDHGSYSTVFSFSTSSAKPHDLSRQLTLWSGRNERSKRSDP
jgi:hypothetical protein